MTDRHARFTALLEPLWDGLSRFAHYKCWDKNSAEDCLQAAILIAYQKFDGFTPGTSFKAWTYRILLNVILNQNTKTRRSQARTRHSSLDLEHAVAEEQEEPWEDALEDPESLLERVSDQVRGAVRSLQPKQRAVFLLRATQGFRYRDIAQFMGIPIGTVMSHLFRARRHLRETLATHARLTGFARHGTRPAVSVGIR